MITWTLIILVHTSAVAFTKVEGFKTEISCNDAGKKTKNLDVRKNQVSFICVEIK